VWATLQLEADALIEISNLLASRIIREKEYPTWEDHLDMHNWVFHRALDFLRKDHWRCHRCAGCKRYMVVWKRNTKFCDRSEEEGCRAKHLARKKAMAKQARTKGKKYPSRQPAYRRKQYRLKRQKKRRQLQRAGSI